VIAGLLRDHYGVFGANLDMDGSFEDPKGRVVNRRRQFGTMILSRFQIIPSRNFPLPECATMTRHSIQQGLLEAVFDPGSVPLRIHSVHLNHLTPETRLLKVGAMPDIFDRAQSEGGAWCGGHPVPGAG
jgi:endonuclease/exonuclease/phosphatase family metal-dependent hydrolase